MPNVDLAKRRRIMRRSQKLGHCICDPRRSCPCDVFTDRGICPCAGERPDPVPMDRVRLTERVRNAGCASKIPPGDLEAVLSRLPTVDDPALLAGIPAGDDAGIYALADGVTLVQTVDVFTPCVDDPHVFGRICAANCLSDVYAMGGVPRTALSILGFPSESLDGQIMYRMMAGAMEAFEAADVALIGGHSIKDEEIKLGFAITGTVDADRAVEHGTACVGDVLVLTKPLGVGVLTFARQIGRAHPAGLSAAEASMAALNRDAAETMMEVGVSACTDVTGFGLFGHLIGMARRSGVTAQVYADALPAFAGALEALRGGVIPGAVERNREYVADDITVAAGVEEAPVLLGFDAQTSGGLLIAVPQARHGDLLAALDRRGVAAATVGRIVAESSGRIAVTLKDQDAPAPTTDEEGESDEPGDHSGPAAPDEARGSEPGHEACCADVFDDEAAPAEASETVRDARRAFGSMMRATGMPGRIDGRTKELINFALVVLARCAPCVEAHLAKARKMGISDEELEEAAWCAVAMGGAPVKMFYENARADAAQSGEGGECCSS